MWLELICVMLVLLELRSLCSCRNSSIHSEGSCIDLRLFWVFVGRSWTCMSWIRRLLKDKCLATTSSLRKVCQGYCLRGTHERFVMGVIGKVSSLKVTIQRNWTVIGKIVKIIFRLYFLMFHYHQGTILYLSQGSANTAAYLRVLASLGFLDLSWLFLSRFSLYDMCPASISSCHLYYLLLC